MELSRHDGRETGNEADDREPGEMLPLVRVALPGAGAAATGATWPADRVPLPEADRGAAGQFFDHRAAEHIFHDHIGRADFARRRFAALRAIPARVQDAAALFALRDGFAHAVGDAVAAIIAEGGDGEELVLGLKGDGLQLRLFCHQARDVSVDAVCILSRGGPRNRCWLGRIVRHRPAGYARVGRPLAKLRESGASCSDGALSP